MAIWSPLRPLNQSWAGRLVACRTLENDTGNADLRQRTRLLEDVGYLAERLLFVLIHYDQRE